MSCDLYPYPCYLKFEDALCESLHPLHPRGDADLTMQIRSFSGFWFVLPSGWPEDDCFDYIYDFLYYIASHIQFGLEGDDFDG